MKVYNIGKKNCRFIQRANTWIFESGSTIVCAVVERKVYVTKEKYSKTTSSHIGIFHDCLVYGDYGVPKMFDAYIPTVVSGEFLESLRFS